MNAASLQASISKMLVSVSYAGLRFLVAINLGSQLIPQIYQSLVFLSDLLNLILNALSHLVSLEKFVRVVFLVALGSEED